MAPSKTNGSANGHINGRVSASTTGAQVLDPSQQKTDRSRWRLEVGEGNRHVWHYLKSDEDIQKWPQSTADKYFLGLPTVCHHYQPSPSTKPF